MSKITKVLKQLQLCSTKSEISHLKYFSDARELKSKMYIYIYILYNIQYTTNDHRN